MEIKSLFLRMRDSKYHRFDRVYAYITGGLDACFLRVERALLALDVSNSLDVS